MGTRRFGSTARLSAALVVASLGMAAVTAPAPASARPESGEGVAAPASPPEGDVPDLAQLGWTRVFDEEFEGTSVDRSVWNIHEGGGVSGPGQYRADALRTVDDPDEGGTDRQLEVLTYSEDSNGSAPGGLKYWTGELRTGPTWGPGFAHTYGYVEARVKINSARETRSAFWMLSSTAGHDAPFGDPAASGPEIDIFEIAHPLDGDKAPADGNCDFQPVAAPCDRIATGTFHWDGFDEDHKTQSQKQVLPAGTSVQNSWHTWSLLWTPDGYRMYMDGKSYFESNEAITYSPEYLILSQHNWEFEAREHGYDYGPRGASTNGRMTVDYVKVWQRPLTDLPHRTVAANRPVSIPFSVMDFDYAPPTTPEAGAVQVTATSSNQAVVPNNRMIVTGNGPTDPDGQLQNPGFESDMTGWTETPATPADRVSTWTNRKHSGSRALRVIKAGGRAEQTIAGLQPNTDYTIGGFYNLELEWTDANGNGRIDWTDTDGDDVCEDTDSFETVTDGNARFDWGIVDVDASLAGNQGLLATPSRVATTERCQYWTPHTDDWHHRVMRFTTGPNTTQVTLFVDNRPYAGTANDSNLSFDDVHVRPAIPPDRTLTVRPVDGVADSTTITLTATDPTRPAGQQTLGTEVFQLTFNKAGSFTNGDFEATPIGAGWNLVGDASGRGASVVVDNPFTVDRVLELAGPAREPQIARRANGTAFQTVTNLRPNQDYVLGVRGKGALAFGVQAYDGSGNQVDGAINSPDWTPQPVSVQFKTGPTHTTANIFLLDWDTSAPSWADDVTLTPAPLTGVSVPPVVAPALTTVGEQRIPANAPYPLSVTLPASGSITGVTSSNPSLFPNRNLAGTPGTVNPVLSLTPLPDRTGKATITVAYSINGTPQTPRQIPVVVSDHHLTNPTFEQGAYRWIGGTVVGGTSPRSGAGAMRLPDDGTEVVQTLTALPYNTSFVLDGWKTGAVIATVRTVPEDASDQAVPHTATWTGAGWTEHQLRFSTRRVTDSRAAGSTVLHEDTDQLIMAAGAQVQVVLKDANPGDGTFVHVDDLALWHTPAIRPLRDISLPQTRTTFDTHSRMVFGIGQVSSGTPWNPAVTQVTSSNTAILPPSNIELSRPDTAYAHRWRFRVRASASQAPGRSDVTLRITDPATGISSQETFTVTFNAGNNFADGDLERGSGWQRAIPNPGWEVREKQNWTWLTFRCALPFASIDFAPCNAGVATIGPNDSDQVLRISSGIAAYRVTGLVPGTSYVVQASAIGNGSMLRAVANDWPGCTDTDPATDCHIIFGSTRGSVPINSQVWGPTQDLTFTPVADDPATNGNESEVWIMVWDENADGPDAGSEPDDPSVPWSAYACALFVPWGETCIDDIAILRP